MKCLSNDQLVQYVEGFLNERARDSINRHVESCINCRTELEIFRKLQRCLVEYSEFCGRKAVVKKEVMNRIERIDHNPSVSAIDTLSSAMTVRNSAVQTSNLSTSEGGKHYYPEELITMDKQIKSVGIQVKPYGYTHRMLRMETREKEYLARYVIADLQLNDGEGVVADAGSSCLTFFTEYADRICEDFRHLTFLTNNNMILKFWEQSEEQAIREIKVEILGSTLDVSHQAFYGEIARKVLMSAIFSPAAVIIGCSGLYLDEEIGISFSYHGGWQERDFKYLLFQCPAIRKRFILATASKIRSPGMHSFNIPGIPDLDERAPICLLTTGPKQDDSDTARHFSKFRKIFYGNVMQERMKEYAPNLKLEWIVLDPETGERVYDEFDEAKTNTGSEVATAV